MSHPHPGRVVRAATAALVAAMAIVVVGSAPPASAERIRYRPPAAAPIVDGWRPPSTPYGPGNRGVDYGTAPGAAVLAPADGVVTFTGRVARVLYVVIGHRDGIRTSLGGLATATVTSGDKVTAGQVIGTAAGPVHFGARRGSVYLDPLSLMVRPPARLIARTG